jgi:hypothetical protein
MTQYLGIIILVIITFTSIPTVTDAVTPTLKFYKEDNLTHPFYEVQGTELDDIQKEPGLVGALNETTIACATGLWKFYPALNYTTTTPFPGYRIGSSHKRVCFDLVPQPSPNLKEMQSMRALAPELDQMSLVTFSEKHGMGIRTVYTEADFTDGLMPVPDLDPIPLSYVITGLYDDDEELQPDDARAPVFRFFADPQGDGSLPTACVALVNDYDGGVGNERAKVYYGEDMARPDGNGEEELELRAVGYFPRDDSDADETCKNTWVDVPPTMNSYNNRVGGGSGEFVFPPLRLLLQGK